VIVPALVFTFGPQRRPHYMLPALAPMCVVLALVTRAVFETARTRGPWLPPAAAVAFTVVITVEVALGGTAILWSKERFVVADLGGLAARSLPATTPLFALGAGAEASSYYARRPIRFVRSMQHVVTALATSPGRRVGLLTKRPALAQLPADVTATILGSGLAAADDFVLAELTPRQATQASQRRGRGSANGSTVASRCQVCSMRQAASSATSTPSRVATSCSVMSMPADTPDDVQRLRSSTQRARRIHSTSGPCETTQSQARLLDVARWPSSRPARASRADPVHTDVT
jgi:hypothetical protein